MPDSGAILWAGIAGLILLMLGIIGYLISTGFASLKSELGKIWDKIDAHNLAAGRNEVAIHEINVRCEERHRERSGFDRRQHEPLDL